MAQLIEIIYLWLWLKVIVDLHLTLSPQAQTNMPTLIALWWRLHYEQCCC